MTAKNESYFTFCYLFRDPWLKPIPGFIHVLKQGNYITTDSTNSEGMSPKLSFRTDLAIEIYAKETWKENSPTIYITTMKPILEIDELFGRRFRVLPVDVPYLRFDVKTVPNQAESTGYKRKTYKIQAGENLTSIAKKNRTTVDMLLKLNPQIKNRDLIRQGQIIKLPT